MCSYFMSEVRRIMYSEVVYDLRLFFAPGGGEKEFQGVGVL